MPRRWRVCWGVRWARGSRGMVRPSARPAGTSHSVVANRRCGRCSKRADEILSRLPPRAGIGIDVQRVLTTRIAGGDTRIDTVARELAVSPRSLQRRLAAEGVSYHELVDSARKEAAARYVAGSALSLAE